MMRSRESFTMVGVGQVGGDEISLQYSSQYSQFEDKEDRFGVTRTCHRMSSIHKTSGHKARKKKKREK